LALGWQAALLFCALLLLGWSFAIGIRRKAWDADRDQAAPVLAAPFASLALIWRNRVLRWLALSSLVYSAVQLCLTGFLVTYLVAEVGLQLALAGTILAVTHTAGAAGRLAWGWIADRLKSGTLAMIALGVIGIAGALATSAIEADWKIWAIAAATALFGFCAVGWNGVFMAVIVRQVPPQHVGSATGGTLCVTYAGIVVGPAAFAALHDRAGLSYGDGYALLALVTALGIACLIQARRNR
jgi:fucose permease